MAAPTGLRLFTKNIFTYQQIGSTLRQGSVTGCIERFGSHSRLASAYSGYHSEGEKDRHRTHNGRFSRLGIPVGLVFATTAIGLQKVEDHVKPSGLPKHPGPLSVKVTKSVKVDTDNYGVRMTLFQYQTCPFCCKVRALLDYYGFSYDVVEVNSVWRTETKWSKYKKVPVLVIHGEKEDDYQQLNDSSVIMSVLESYLLDRNQSLQKLVSFYPAIESPGSRGKTEYEFPNKYFIMYQDMKVSSTVEQMKLERKWRKWVDSELVHSLSPNVYRTPSEAIQSFRYFSEVGDWEKIFSTFERTVVIYLGATVMYFIGKLLKRKYELKADVRESLYDQCEQWVRAVGKHAPFLGGDQPNLADLSVYGVLKSIEGCDAFQDVLKNTKIEGWYRRMARVVSLHGGANTISKKR